MAVRKSLSSQHSQNIKNRSPRRVQVRGQPAFDKQLSYPREAEARTYCASLLAGRHKARFAQLETAFQQLNLYRNGGAKHHGCGVYMYRCPGCGFEAMVTGGSSAGMQMVTLTVACRSCKALSDAYAGRYARDPEVELRCGDCGSTDVIPWTAEHGCPICEGDVERDDDLTMLWD